MYSKQELMQQIRAMGIEPTDTVLIHTSMRAIGEVEGGCDGVIDAFIDVLSQGLFLVPTHTWSVVGKDQPVYDVTKTVPNIGALPRTAAFRPDGIRSLHPTHSIWGHGEGAAAFLAGEEKAQTPAPVGFAWERLGRIGAKILLLGVGLDKNTFIHAVDEIADIADRLDPVGFDATIVDAQGRQYHSDYHPHYCSRSDDVSRQFVNFEKALVDCGAMQYGQLGNARVRIVDAARCRDVILRIYSRAREDLCIRFMDIPESYWKV